MISNTSGYYLPSNPAKYQKSPPSTYYHLNMTQRIYISQFTFPIDAKLALGLDHFKMSTRTK